MQALCKPSDDVSADVKCPICAKGFRLFWERTNVHDQLAALPEVLRHLRSQHDHGEDHPDNLFNVPHWSGLPEFSGAALLGGAV